MAKREIRNPLDRKNRNNHNNNYTELYKLKKTVNSLVLDSGESNAEVVQARAGEDTLNDRLDNMESATSNVSGDVSDLEGSMDGKLDNKASLSDLDSYSQEVSDELEDKLKEVNETIEDAIGNVEFKGAQLIMTKNQELNDSSWKIVQWDKAVYNQSGFWSSKNKSRIVIPEGVQKARFVGGTLWPSNSDGSRRLRILKNGNYVTGGFYNSVTAGGTSPVGASSGIIETTSGDYFEMEVFQSSGEKLDLREDPYTFFQIEVMDYRKK